MRYIVVGSNGSNRDRAAWKFRGFQEDRVTDLRIIWTMWNVDKGTRISRAVYERQRCLTCQRRL